MILVIGATGRVGAEVARRLTPQLARPFTRAEGDLARPETLVPALRGASACFLVWPLFDSAQAPDAVELVCRSVDRVVYVSSYTVADEVAHPYTAFHAEIEGLLAAHAREWAALRATSLARNTLGWADDVRSRRTIELAYPEARRAPVHEADVAAAAVALLTATELENGPRVVSGPAEITERERFELLGAALRRHVEVREIDPDAFYARLVAAGTSPELAEAALRHWERLAGDEPEPVTDGIEALTGDPPRTFRSWCEDNVEWFR